MLKPKPGEDPVAFLARCFDDEATMQEVARQAINDNLENGIDVFLLDDKGIYQLYKDGSKRYINKS